MDEDFVHVDYILLRHDLGDTAHVCLDIGRE